MFQLELTPTLAGCMALGNPETNRVTTYIDAVITPLLFHVFRSVQYDLSVALLV